VISHPSPLESGRGRTRSTGGGGRATPWRQVRVRLGGKGGREEEQRGPGGPRYS
jgi:hypothetical protein